MACIVHKGPTNLCNPEFYCIIDFVVLSVLTAPINCSQDQGSLSLDITCSYSKRKFFSILQSKQKAVSITNIF